MWTVAHQKDISIGKMLMYIRHSNEQICGINMVKQGGKNQGAECMFMELKQQPLTCL